MGAIIGTLTGIAKIIVNINFVMFMLIVGSVLYIKNDRVVKVQKAVMGRAYYSTIELTISQIVIGILGGIIISLILTILGIAVDFPSSILIMLIISLILMKVKPRYMCFAYSGPILAFISFFSLIMVKYFGVSEEYLFDINIISLMSLIGVLHLVEGLLILIDGKRGVTPVFAKRKGKIIGGFSISRYWVLPLVFLMVNTYNATGYAEVNNWWPILNGTLGALTVGTVIGTKFIPTFVMIGYNTITFTKEKEKKIVSTAINTSLYGLSLVIFAQLASLNLFMEFLLIIYVPLAHEFMLRIEYYLEVTKSPKFINRDEGLIVLDVLPNSPACKMGIRSGDLLLEANGEPLVSSISFSKIIKEIKNSVHIKIQKNNGKIKEVMHEKLLKGEELGVIIVPNIVENDKNKDSRNFSDVLDRIINKNK